MAEILDPYLINAPTGATATSRLIDCSGMGSIIFESIVQASAATLQGNIQFRGGCEVAVSYFPLVTGVQIGGPNEMPFAPSTGTISLVNVNTGGQRTMVRFLSPPKFMQVIYTFTSGGGSPLVVRVVAYGFQTRTVP